MNRDFSGKRGGEGYAREELVAELCSAFLCAELGVSPTVRHADYLGAWLDVLKGDNRAVFQAASLASKAADYVMGRKPQPYLDASVLSSASPPCANSSA